MEKSSIQHNHYILFAFFKALQRQKFQLFPLQKQIFFQKFIIFAYLAFRMPLTEILFDHAFAWIAKMNFKTSPTKKVFCLTCFKITNPLWKLKDHKQIWSLPKRISFVKKIIIYLIGYTFILLLSAVIRFSLSHPKIRL